MIKSHKKKSNGSNFNKNSHKSTKRISKKQNNIIQKKTEKDLEDSISEHEIPNDEMQLAAISNNEYEDYKTETENEKRLRIARKIIKDKRRLIQNQKGNGIVHSDSEIDESAKEEGPFDKPNREKESKKIDLSNDMQTEIDFINKYRSSEIENMFGGKKIEAESKQNKLRKKLTDQDIELELQKDILEQEERVFYPVFNVIKTEFQNRSSCFETKSLKAHLRPITFCKFDPKSQDLISVGKDSAILRH